MENMHKHGEGMSALSNARRELKDVRMGRQVTSPESEHGSNGPEGNGRKSFKWSGTVTVPGAARERTSWASRREERQIATGRFRLPGLDQGVV